MHHRIIHTRGIRRPNPLLFVCRLLAVWWIGWVGIQASAGSLDTPKRVAGGSGSQAGEQPTAGHLLAPGWVQTRFCISYKPKFKDVGGGEDFWTSNSLKMARGIRVRVRDKATGESPYYGYTGRKSGCTPWMDLDSKRTYQIRTYSQAKVSPGAVNTVDVRNNPTDNQRYVKTLAAAHKPSTGTRELVWQNSSANDVVNIVAAAGYSINRRYGGLSGETFVLFNTPCPPDDAGSCAKEEGGGTVYLSTVGRDRKFIISHELGHAVGIRANEGKRAKMKNLQTQTTCKRFLNSAGKLKHAMTSKEYQGLAAHEGFAHFYAASVWNDPKESDCAYAYYLRYDFDHDGGSPEPWEDDPWVSCRDSWPQHVLQGVPHTDFLHKVCDPEPGVGFADRGTEYDWLRALWAVHGNGGVSYGAFVDIWDRANPHEWNANGKGVSKRLTDAAKEELSTSDFAAWKAALELHGLNE